MDDITAFAGFPTWFYPILNFGVAASFFAVASLIVLRRMGKATPLVWLTTALSVIGMAYVFYANVFPVPAFPFTVPPWIFLGLVLLAVLR